jgi:multidrug efflux pump subunit AcrA (membrane-fusion protein)
LISLLGEKALLLQQKKVREAKEQAEAAQAEALQAKTALEADSSSSTLALSAKKTLEAAHAATKRANLLQSALDKNKSLPSKSPFESNKDLTWFLSYARKIQAGSSQTHALVSASLSTRLQNYVNREPKNPFRLWALIKERFHNKAFDLEANLDRFDWAVKGAEEKVIDYISCLETYRRLITTVDNKVGDDAFLRRLQ